jgi:hypothetical protein
MIVYSLNITNRLKYICDFIGNELLGKPFELTNSKEHYLDHSGVRINYSPGKLYENEFWLRPHSLLFEKDIKQQNTECFEVNGSKAFFENQDDFPFDIFAASFYLLSRIRKICMAAMLMKILWHSKKIFSINLW